MSTIGTTLPASLTQSSSTSSQSTGLQALTPSDFINMMVTQLQNQDPLNPTSSSDLLSQMSEIGQLQSADSLQTTLSGLSLQNQIGAASSLIGKVVQGTDANNNPLQGTVTSVTITQTPAAQSPTGQAITNVNLNLSTGSTLALSNVTAIAPGAAAATTTAATSASATTPLPVSSANTTYGPAVVGPTN